VAHVIFDVLHNENNIIFFLDP